MNDSVRYRSFEHVERLSDDKMDVAAYLDTDKLYVFPKMDGTSALVWAADGIIHCGSRKREIDAENDNANFYRYITESEGEDVARLCEFCLSHEGLIIYGEHIGHTQFSPRFVGSIKSYIEGGFYVFAVFDVERGDYMPYPEYAALLDGVYDKVLAPIAVLDHPKLSDVEAFVDENHFNLPENELGEGVVAYNYGYRNKFRNIQIGKIVRDEYKASKSKPKKQYVVGEFEQEFVDYYITAAFMDKCRNKVCQILDIADFDTSNPKHVNIFLNLLVSDGIDEDIYTFVKKKKFPVIDFGALKGLIMATGRKFLGLV